MILISVQGEQGSPGPPGPPGPPGELPLLPPELAGFQQNALARWKREFNDINTEDSKKSKTDNSGPNDNNDGPKYIDIVSSIYGMRQDLERIRKPVGTRDNPVMTCKDLFYGHPQFKDGNYNYIRIINVNYFTVSYYTNLHSTKIVYYQAITIINSILYAFRLLQ